MRHPNYLPKKHLLCLSVTTDKKKNYTHPPLSGRIFMDEIELILWFRTFWGYLICLKHQMNVLPIQPFSLCIFSTHPPDIATACSFQKYVVYCSMYVSASNHSASEHDVGLGMAGPLGAPDLTWKPKFLGTEEWRCNILCPMHNNHPISIDLSLFIHLFYLPTNLSWPI